MTTTSVLASSVNFSVKEYLHNRGGATFFTICEKFERLRLQSVLSRVTIEVFKRGIGVYRSI